MELQQIGEPEHLVVGRHGVIKGEVLVAAGMPNHPLGIVWRALGKTVPALRGGVNHVVVEQE
jgi:hypothetical protein